jgi:hypothetical protein
MRFTLVSIWLSQDMLYISYAKKEAPSFPTKTLSSIQSLRIGRGQIYLAWPDVCGAPNRTSFFSSIWGGRTIIAQ